MDSSKCLLLAVTVAMNAALIVALIIRNDCGLPELMELPNTILVLFGMLSFDVVMYLAFELLWPVRSIVDEKICSQALLEKGHDHRVGNKNNQVTDSIYADDHVHGELEDNNKTLGTGLNPVLSTFDIGEKSLSKTSQDHLGQTVGKEASISKALHVELAESFACHGSFFLSEHEGNTRNLLPYGQAPTSIDGSANGEDLNDALSASLSQELVEWAAARCNEINDTLKSSNEDTSSMYFGQVREFFPAHAQFVDILDKFWANLFGLDGKLTEKGKIIRLDLLIGLDVGNKIQTRHCYFDGTPEGLCGPSNLVNYSTMEMPPVFGINNSIYPQEANSTLAAVVELRSCIMDSFLKENPSLLTDERLSYFVMANGQVQYEVPIYENFQSVAKSICAVSNSTTCRVTYPLEELNTMAVLVQKCPSQQVAQQASPTNVFFSYNELKWILLNSLRACIQNIADLEKADWLIQHRGGYDEKVIGLASEMVIFRDIFPVGALSPNTVVDLDGRMFNICTLNMGCEDACMWQPSLIISFGVWCISRIFEVLLTVRQPVLLGKYSRVLSRLQGILDSAFLNPVERVSICQCAPRPSLPDGSQDISAEAMLKKLMEVEATIYGPKCAWVRGKGKKDLNIVLERYKCRLSKAASVAGQK
ncbi:hypothetical protein ACP70R_026617 [Stipagrostis hirtigluma subsp. patula]